MSDTRTCHLMWCESCDGPMSETGRFPAQHASEVERAEHRAIGKALIVPLVNRSRWPILICEDCNKAYEQWEKEA